MMPRTLNAAACAVLLVTTAAQGADERQDVVTLHLSETTVAKVYVSSRGSVLSFPAKPEKVILGSGTGFGIEYVEADLALTPLSPKARSNLFVYLQGRRFTLELIASSTAGASIVLVRDALEEEPHGQRKTH